MPWPIDWDDDDVADGDNIETDPSWARAHDGIRFQRSDEHDDHSFGGASAALVSDANNPSIDAHMTIWTPDIEPSTHIKISTYVWPDRQEDGGRNAAGLILRKPTTGISFPDDIDFYRIRIRAGDNFVDFDDEFLLELDMIANDSTTFLASATDLTTGVWSDSKTAMLLEVEVENVAGDPVFTITVDGTVEITYTDTVATYTSVGFSGRYLGRFSSGTDEQPFVQDFTAEDLSAAGGSFPAVRRRRGHTLIPV